MQSTRSVAPDVVPYGDTVAYLRGDMNGWSTDDAFEMGIQFSGKNNWNLPETGILPLLPNYTSFTSGVYLSQKGQMGLVKFETGARYDFLTRKVVRLTSTQPREIERFQDIYHNIALLSRGTVMLNKKWQLLGELAYKQRPPEINELYSFSSPIVLTVKPL